ncbi:phosphatidate cytidylyltransferase [Candidatus Methylocalor cossyra]
MTALILAPLAVLAVLLLPLDGFAALWGAVILIAAWEWTDLSGLEGVPSRAAAVGVVLAVLLTLRYSAVHWAPSVLPGWFYWPVVGWWFLCGLAFRQFPEKLLQLPYPRGVKLAVGGLVLISAWALMVWLRVNFGPLQVLYLVVLVWVADAAAYFIGKRWGNTKLSEHISPGKTVEGAYGALLGATLFAVAVGLAFRFEAIQVADFAFLSLLTVMASICGDLLESLAKRVRGVKDSSAMLPGHGGLLDRIDSLLAAVAVFYAGSLALGIFLDLDATATPLDLGHSQDIAPLEEPESAGGMPSPPPGPMDAGSSPPSR